MFHRCGRLFDVSFKSQLASKEYKKTLEKSYFSAQYVLTSHFFAEHLY